MKSSLRKDNALREQGEVGKTYNKLKPDYKLEMVDPVSQFKVAILDAGITPPDMIEHGKIHRFPGKDKSACNTAGWCILFDDGLGGAFGDYSTGLTENWQAKRDKPFSHAEHEQFMRQVAEAKKQRESDEKARHAQAATKAAEIWQSATPALDDFPYLKRKGIKASGAKLHDGKLVIPLRDGGKIHSLQFIDADGGKKFLHGGRVTGCCFSIGHMNGAAALCICEGFATGASIHEATGLPVPVVRPCWLSGRYSAYPVIGAPGHQRPQCHRSPAVDAEIGLIDRLAFLATAGSDPLPTFMLLKSSTSNHLSNRLASRSTRWLASLYAGDVTLDVR